LRIAFQDLLIGVSALVLDSAERRAKARSLDLGFPALSDDSGVGGAAILRLFRAIAGDRP